MYNMDKTYTHTLTTQTQSSETQLFTPLLNTFLLALRTASALRRAARRASGDPTLSLSMRNLMRTMCYRCEQIRIYTATVFYGGMLVIWYFWFGGCIVL